VDINFQSVPDEELAGRVLLYNALVADRRQLSGKLSDVGRRRKGKMDFSSEMIRLWQQPVRRYLAGGLGTLPLVPLCRLLAADCLEAALAPVIRRVVERLEREAGSLRL
jgi:hypothetical protein